MTTPAQADPQARYQQAAVAAAALYAASKASPNPVEAIKHTITSAANLTAAVSDSTTTAVLRLWRRTDPYNQTAVDQFVSAAGKLVVSAQRSTARVSAAAQVSQLKAVGITTKVSVTIPDQVRGSTATFGNKVTVVAPAKATVEYDRPSPQATPAGPQVDVVPRTSTTNPERARSATVEVGGNPASSVPAKTKATVQTSPRPTPVTTEAAPRASVTVPSAEKPVTRVVLRSDSAPEMLFNRAVVTYRYERSTGTDHATANAAAEQRIEDLVSTNVMLAQRLAEQQTLSRTVDLDQKVLGYRRVFHPELSRGGSCGLCIAASDRVYKLSELKPIHTNCKCTIAPVTEDADPGHRINTQDLETLYAHAGTTSGRTRGMNLKRTRYVIEQHHELGPVLTRVSGEKLPYTSDPDPVSAQQVVDLDHDVAPSPRTETARDVAARHLPALRASLERLRAQGAAEDSPPVQYHLAQIAKFEALTASQ